MKKQWNQPVLEILDVNKTMGGTNYDNFDSDYQDSTTIPVNGKGQPLIGS